MRKCAACLLLICAPLLVACQTNAPVMACDGWRAIPTTPAGAVKLSRDPDLEMTGRGVAEHNLAGLKYGCWK